MDPLTIIALGMIPLILSKKRGSTKSGSVSLTTKAPKGKGVFFRSLKHAGTYENFLNDIKTLRLDWICILTHWQSEDEKTLTYLNDNYIQWLYQIKKDLPHLKIWFWAWPDLWDIEGFVEYCLQFEKYEFCSGYVIDTEKAFLKQNEFAVSFVAALDKLKKPKGLTSYGGGEAYVPNFPWSEFSKLDFGMPQIYDKENKLGDTYPKKSVISWSKYFKTILPVWTGSDIHTLDQIKNIIMNTPYSAQGHAWWDYYAIKQRPDVYQFVSTFNWKKTIA